MASEERKVEARDAKERARADHNRNRKIEAVRALERLISYLLSDSRHGLGSVEIAAKDGRIGRVKTSLVEYGEE